MRTYVIKTILFLGFIAISTTSVCQKVTYKDLIGTAWRLFDSTRALTITLQFIDSSHLIHKSWDPRYQPSLKTVIKYSLDDTKNPTLLNLEWEGEMLKCTSCSISISDQFLIIENSGVSKANKPLSKIEELQTKWIFKKVVPQHK